MNKIKKEFENVKLSKNMKIELYDSIISKTTKKHSFMPKLLNVSAIFILIFIVGLGGVYAASRIFGFNVNFLNFFDYNEEELVEKGIESEVVDLSIVDGDKKMTITNVIFDGNKIDLFADLTNIKGTWFGLLKDGKNIVKSSVVDRLTDLELMKKEETFQSVMISFEVNRELNDGDIVTLVHKGSHLTNSNKDFDENPKIDIKLNGTITKKLHIKTTGAKLEKDEKKYNIYDVKVSPMSVAVSIECSGDVFDEASYGEPETMYNVFIGTKEKEYKASSYPIIVEKIDDTHAKILYNIEYHDEFINPDDVTYVRVYNYKINRNGSVENIGNSLYVEYEQKKKINDKGVYMYIGNSPLLDIAKSLSYTCDIQTYVGLSDENVARLYNNGKLIREIKLDWLPHCDYELASLYYDAMSLKKESNIK